MENKECVNCGKIFPLRTEICDVCGTIKFNLLSEEKLNFEIDCNLKEINSENTEINSENTEINSENTEINSEIKYKGDEI